MEVQGPSPIQPMRRRPRPVYKLKLGETIGTTFSVYFRYFLPLTLATIVVAVLVLGADLLSIEQFREAADPAAAWIDAPTSLLSTPRERQGSSERSRAQIGARFGRAD